MSQIPKPHGEILIDRIIPKNKKEQILESFSQTLVLQADDSIIKDIENIAKGVYSPLEGFLNQNDYLNVLKENRLQNDNVWTIPIVLDIDKNTSKKIMIGDTVSITDINNKPFAIMEIEDVYPYDKKKYSESVFGTNDASHPGVNKINQMNEIFIGGKISLIQEDKNNLSSYFTPPRETRKIFKERKWNTVVGFQTRNVPHLGHEGLQKAALNICDGLFINPVIGKKKPGDFKDEIIVDTYKKLIKNYFQPNNVTLGTLPTEMHYAGPKEAIHHAIMRKNFGCSHFIVGRDHAGVGNFYDPFAAQHIFNEFPDLEIKPLFFPEFFYCHKCITISNTNSCSHILENNIRFSGKLLRKFLSSGETPPNTLIRQEIFQIIKSHNSPFI